MTVGRESPRRYNRIVTLRNAILLLGVFGIFFAFACPLAPTPTLVCKTFLLLLFVFVLTLMSRSGKVIATVSAYLAPRAMATPCSPPPGCGSVLLC